MPPLTTAAGTLPKPDGDFYQVVECLNDAERDTLKQVRAFMEAEVAPVITKYWAEDSFPFEVLPGLRDLKIGGLGYSGYSCRGGSTLLTGFVMMEMARVDASFATFFGDDNGETRGRCLGAQWPEEVDRQLHLVRSHRDLGARSGGQPGQGLHRREQDDTRLQSRKDSKQNCTARCPERVDHAGQL